MHEPQDDREELPRGHEGQDREDGGDGDGQEDQHDLGAGDDGQPKGQHDEVVIATDLLGEEIRAGSGFVRRGHGRKEGLLGDSRETRAPDAVRPEVFNEVDRREDDDPDDVDEVPVEARDFDVEGAHVAAELTREAVEIHHDEPEYADGDVRTVRTGQDVERRPEDAILDGQAFVVEVGELVDLAAQEDQAEEDHAQNIAAEGLDLALVHRGDRERHQERGHQQDERREGRQLDVEQVLDEALVAFGVGEAGGEELAVEQVRRDERPEEHAVRSQEEPHDELLVVDPGGRRRFVRGGGVRHGGQSLE